MIEQHQYTVEDLENRLKVINENGPKIENCLTYAISKLAVYHNGGAKGIIVDDAMYDVYAKLDAALTSYKNYNGRVIKRIEGKKADLVEKEIAEEKNRSSSIPRRSINSVN